MTKSLILFCLIIQTLVSFAQTKTDVSGSMVIKNISVITMLNDNILKNQDVIIKDGKINAISNSENSDYKGVLIVDGKGKYIMPSLSDAHVHFPIEEKEMTRVMEFYLINGVTKLRSMRGDWKHFDWRAKYNAKNSIYPKLYISPPPVSRKDDFTPSQIDEYVKKAKEKDFDFLKILSIKNQTILTQFDSVCKKYNLPIAGHFPSNVPDSLIFNSNYTSFEHLGGLTRGSGAFKRRLQLLRQNNMFICPTLSYYSIGSGRYTYNQLRNLSGMEFIPIAIIDEWIEKTKVYREKLGNEAYVQEINHELKSLDEKYKIIKKLHELGVPMLLSPDSSSKYMVQGFNMVGEMELLKNAELENYDILKMTTTNFATFFKENYGTIEVGGNADFIILNNNPLEDFNALKKIEGIYFNSQFLDSEKLETMRLKLLEMSQN